LAVPRRRLFPPRSRRASTVILFDPIFQGLAISLMAGEVASTALSRMAVPILYHLSERRGERRRKETANAARRPIVETA
jgi:hypothetical protein